MKICFYEDSGFKLFHPLTHTRPVYTMRAGILPLFKRVERLVETPNICLSTRNALAEPVALECRDYPINIIKREEGQPVLMLNGRLREYGELIPRCSDGRLITRFVSRDGDTVGVLFPAGFDHGVPALASPEQYLEAYRQHQSDIAEIDIDATLYKYPWNLVDDVEAEIAADFKYLRPGLSGQDKAALPSGVDLIEPERIHIGRSATILPGTLLDASHGPVFIGDNTRIESQVAIYGPCFIGANSQVLAGKVTGSSIGHTSRVGGEVEETIFHSYVNKYHAGFIGHSYVGSWVNFGAMTTNSDLKNNYSNIRVTLNGESIDTGSIKVGSFIGDHTKFGIGTLLNTGINIGVCCNLFGGTLIADKEVPSFSWGQTGAYQPYLFDKAIQTIRATAARRQVTLTSGEESMLQAIAEGKENEAGVLDF